MRILDRTAPALSVLALVAVLGGCGGGGGTSKSDYRKQLQQVDQQFKSQIQAPEQALSSASTNQQRISALTPLIPRIKALADKVDSLKPPSGLQDEQNRVVAALRKESADMAQLKSVLQSKDVNKLKALVPQLTSDATELQTSVSSLRAQVNK